MIAIAVCYCFWRVSTATDTEMRFPDDPSNISVWTSRMLQSCLMKDCDIQVHAWICDNGDQTSALHRQRTYRDHSSDTITEARRFMSAAKTTRAIKHHKAQSLWGTQQRRQFIIHLLWRHSTHKRKRKPSRCWRAVRPCFCFSWDSCRVGHIAKQNRADANCFCTGSLLTYSRTCGLPKTPVPHSPMPAASKRYDKYPPKPGIEFMRGATATIKESSNTSRQ